MQLKRDIDYSLQILYVLSKNTEQYGKSIQDINAHTQVPRGAIVRLCRVMLDKGLIKVGQQELGTQLYYIPEERMDMTLSDLVEALESTKNLLAVFDHHSEMYRACGSKLEKVNRYIGEDLECCTIQELFM